MYCRNCGTQVDLNVKFCPNCGNEVDMLPVGQQNFTVRKKDRKKVIAMCSIILVIVLVSVFAIIRCSKSVDGTSKGSDRTSKGLDGTYESLTGDRVFKLEQTDKNEGTFEIYEDGKSIDEKNIRYKKTWERDKDILVLEYDDDSTYYFLIIDDGFIQLEDEDDEPSFSDYIAPKGKTFEYEIGGKKFFEDGTYEYEMSYYGTATGKYYREDNVIYCKNDAFTGTEEKFGSVAIYPGEKEYEASYYIYNDDYITSAGSVYLKK